MLRPPSELSVAPLLTYLQNDNDDADSLHRPASNIATVGSNDSNDRYNWEAGPSDLSRRITKVIYGLANCDSRTHLELHEEEDVYDDHDRRFINPSFLSHLAVQLQDKVPRGTHVKGNIPYPKAFTGKDIVVCQSSRPPCLKLVC